MLDWQSFIHSIEERQWSRLVATVFALLLLYSLYEKIAFFTHHVSVSLADDRESIAASPLPNIAAWHMFGDYTTIRAALLPKTQLNLTLEGIFFTKNSQQSQAIIAVPGQAAKVYRQGQAVPGGAVIKEILVQGVVLQLGGELQLLPLKLFHLQFAPSPTINLPEADS